MKIKILFSLLVILTGVLTLAFAGDKSLDGAYKFVSVTFPGGSQSEANAKGLILIHGKYWANVRSAVDRKTWDEKEPENERIKKVAAAYRGLTAGCGTFEIEGNVVNMYQLAGANPKAVGTASKWEFKLEGEKLTLKPVAAPGVEFTFERLP